MRRATPDDARGIALLLAAVAEEGRWIGTRAPVDVAVRTARIRADFASGRVESFVIVRGDAIVGDLSLMTEGMRSTIGMCLALDMRGRGWGGALLDIGIAHAEQRGVAVLALAVYTHNARARRLYASRGFADVGTDVDDRGNGVVFDVIVMERRLTRDEHHVD